VHVWRVRLDVADGEHETLGQMLSHDEHGRAGRFHFAKDRLQFIIRRAALRNILARYLNAKPASIEFAYTDHGKPILAGAWHHEPINFNLSHTGTIALIGLARHRNVGVDIERIEPARADAKIAARFFSPGERASLAQLAQGSFARAFFDCWTRKEAYIKARGLGLALPLDGFEVDLTSSQGQALLRADVDSTQLGRWHCVSLPCGDDYAACVVADGWPWQTACFDWEA